jgi:adenylylsulfate kinase
MMDKKKLENTVLWFTGLSGAGKTTLATELKVKLEATGLRVYLLDGDVLRIGINSDLGFSTRDRSENIRRAAYVAKLFCAEGYCVLATFISPLESDRKRAREIIGNEWYKEIFVQCPLTVCEQRDVKGLYKKARAGLLLQFTGIDSPYEEPLLADVTIHSDRQTIADAVNLILKNLL